MRRIALACLLAFATNAAVAQTWAWKDGTGRMVYSDQAPPPEIKASQIVRAPAGASRPAPAAVEGEAPAATTEAPKGPKSTAELEAEFRKRQMAREEAEKKASEENKRTQVQAENCRRAKEYAAGIDSGVRIRLANGDIADDAQRAAERQRAQEQIAQNCK